MQAALSAVGLDGHADHPAHLLSSGQKQLLALTSVLVTEPDILVLDEPTTLLDLRNARDVMHRLAGLRQQVVLVTHDLSALDGFERVLTVDDEGSGIAEADRPHVFDRFYRAEESRAMPGSGLGLAIVRQVVDRHGGRIEASESPVGGARLIAVASGNRYLVDLVGTLGEPMIAMPSARLAGEPGSLEQVVSEHAAVLGALERGDAETARAAMRVHLAGSIARLGR